MKKHKRSRTAISLFLAVCTLFSLILPVTAAEEEGLSYEVIIDPQYEDADSFSQDLAAVKKDGKWGYIDMEGNTVIPFQFDYAFSFSEGLAVVGTLGEHPTYDGATAPVYFWSVLDKQGNVTPLLYKEEGDTEYKQAKEFVDFLDSSAKVYYHNGYVVLGSIMSVDNYAPSLVFDRTGKQVYLGDYWVGYCLNEGTFAATEAMGGNGLYLDESGKPVLEFSEEAYTRPFNQGLSPLAKYDVEREDFVFGFIDKNGKTVIPFQYQDFYVRGVFTTYQIFCDGIASVKNLNGKWGGIDKQGKTVIPFEYEALGTFLEGLAFACKDGKYGVIDTQNNVVVPFEYTRITSYSNGLAVAVKGGRAFCIDRYGKEVPGSNTISQESYFPAGLESSLTMTPDEIITVIENGKYGFARIGYTQPLPQEGEMADWAYEEVIQAIQHDLVPSDLQNQYYANITRGDFAIIVVQLLEVVSGKDIEDIVLEDTGKTLEELALAYPFSDTNSWDVVAANALGVINGRGEGIFDPYSAISRQDAAALLMRMGKYMGKTDVDTSGETFADNASVASYAQEAVAYVKALGVMNGTSETTFSPFDTYTRQQAYMTIWRLYNVMVTE